jgi:hypothetical protein
MQCCCVLRQSAVPRLDLRWHSRRKVILTARRGHSLRQHTIRLLRTIRLRHRGPVGTGRTQIVRRSASSIVRQAALLVLGVPTI